MGGGSNLYSCGQPQGSEPSQKEERVPGTAGESEGWDPPAIWQVAWDPSCSKAKLFTSPLFSVPLRRLESLSMFHRGKKCKLWIYGQTEHAAVVQGRPAGGDSVVQQTAVGSKHFPLRNKWPSAEHWTYKTHPYCGLVVYFWKPFRVKRGTTSQENSGNLQKLEQGGKGTTPESFCPHLDFCPVRPILDFCNTEL